MTTTKTAPHLVCHLDQLMAKRSLTAARIHAETGISEYAIQKLRRNFFTSIHAETLARLCVYLDVCLDDLLSIERKP